MTATKPPLAAAYGPESGTQAATSATAQKAAVGPLSAARRASSDVSTCIGETCSALIRWARTADGKLMPVNYDPDPTGNLVRVQVAPADWRIRVLTADEDPGPDVLRWTSHYATCPDADRFRGRGRRRGNATSSATTSAAGPATLLAVDGNSLAHRAWHAYQRTGMTGPDGEPVFAVYGFLALLAGIADRVRPDAIVVGFDDRAASVRRSTYPAYKAGRTEKDPDLYSQMDATAALGVRVIVPDGLEADDVLGSAAAAAETAGWRCVIATSDKDAFALVSESTTVLRLMSGLNNAARMTPAAVADQYGVTPDQWLDYVALVGDTSDNLPGVTGIGPKTAAKLLAALGSVDAALNDPAALAEARATIDRNRSLMRICRDVPVDLSGCRPETDPGTVAAALRTRNLSSLTGRVTAVLCPTAPDRRGHQQAFPTQRREEATSSLRLADMPPAPPLVYADPAPVCPKCGRECAAVLPLAQLDAGRTPVLTGGEILIDREHPTGDLIAVLVGDVWAVRRVLPGEYYLPPGNRRLAHHCLVYPYTCVVPGCGRPARLYPSGALCDDHPPVPQVRAYPCESRPVL